MFNDIILHTHTHDGQSTNSNTAARTHAASTHTARQSVRQVKQRFRDWWGFVNAYLYVGSYFRLDEWLLVYTVRLRHSVGSRFLSIPKAFLGAFRSECMRACVHAYVRVSVCTKYITKTYTFRFVAALFLLLFRFGLIIVWFEASDACYNYWPTKCNNLFMEESMGIAFLCCMRVWAQFLLLFSTSCWNMTSAKKLLEFLV